jgi:2-dehydropantoate 2-reductase
VLCRREEHVDALNEHGLRVSGRSDFVTSVLAAADPAQLPEPGLAIVATKTTEVDAVAARLRGHWPRAAVMTVQNGLGAEEAFPGRRVLSAVTFMSGTKHSDTHVEYILDTETWLGPYGDAPYELAEEAAALIVSSGLKARAFRDLRPAQWSKLIFNAPVGDERARHAAREPPLPVDARGRRGAPPDRDRAHHRRARPRGGAARCPGAAAHRDVPPGQGPRGLLGSN